MKVSIQKDLIPFFALAIFVTVMSIVPWEGLFRDIHGYGFIDGEVYKNYFLYEDSILKNIELNTFLSYVSNEVVWHLSVDYVVNVMGGNIEWVFGFISVVCLFIFGLITIKHYGPVALVLLVNPLVVDFAFSQLRLALAISFLGAGYLLRSRNAYVALGIAFCAPFIHTASIVFFSIYVGTIIIEKYSCRSENSYRAQFLLLFLLGGIISLAIGPLRELILSAIGDRRAEYADMSSSLSYASVWILVLFAMMVRARVSLRENFQQYALVVMSIVAVNLLHGGYSTRFLAATFPFLISTILSFRGIYGIFLISALGFYSVLQWVYWLDLV